MEPSLSLPTSSPADAPTLATRHPSSQSKSGTNGFEAMTGHELKQLMKKLGLRPREFCSLLDVSPRTLQRWTNDPKVDVPGSVACAVRSFVLLSKTAHDFHVVSKMNFEEISQV